MDSYGILSVLPVLTILVIAVTTKRTLFAMVCGLSVAAVIIGNVKLSVVKWFEYLYSSMTNETLQWLLLVISMFGMLIVLFERGDLFIPKDRR